MTNQHEPDVAPDALTPSIPNGTAPASAASAASDTADPHAEARRVAELLGETFIEPDVSGAALSAPIDPPERHDRFPYWLGLYPGAPMQSLQACGLTFQKLVELVSKDPYSKDTVRTPRAGVVEWLTRSAVQRVADEMGQMIVRFRQGGGDTPLVGAVDLSGAPKRIGFVLKIPSEAEVAQFRREVDEGLRKRMPPAHRAQETDEPLARYCYLVPALDGKRWKDDELPPPLTETGITLPRDDWRPSQPPRDGGIYRVESAEQALTRRVAERDAQRRRAAGRELHADAELRARAST